MTSPDERSTGPQVVDDARLIAFVDESCKPVRDPSTGAADSDRYHYVLA
ncbi:hypothetical protein [Candidatus Poriferisodalis sp.]